MLPKGISTTIKSIDSYKDTLDMAFAPQSVTLQLSDDIDISRGDMIVGEHKAPEVGKELDLMVCWLNEKPMVLRGKYAAHHTTNDLKCVISDVKYKVDINTLDKNYEDKSIGLNEIARITIKTTHPIFYDPYRTNRITGSIILIDAATNETVGAGMII